MKKILKRLATGFLAFATIVTALPTTAVHASEKQYWCKNMTDVARHILNNDPDFTSLSESVTRYFDYEAYGQYLDDNGRFVETDHGIYELP